MTPQPPTTADWLQQAVVVYGNAIVDLHERFKTTDKRKKLDWEIFDSYCKHEERTLLQAIEAHIKELLDEAKHCNGCGKYISQCSECERLWQT